MFKYPSFGSRELTGSKTKEIYSENMSSEHASKFKHYHAF